MNTRPAISVLMPVFNGERYVAEAIGSILRQTFSNYEFLIIDDGSTDRTREIIRSFSDPRIRLLERPHEGLVAQLNYGLGCVAAPLIARLDHDDIASETRLIQQNRLLDAHPEIGIVGSSYRLMDAEGRRGIVKWMPESDQGIRSLLPMFCPLSHGTVMYRKQIVIDAGGYSSTAFPNEDYELWLRLSRITLLRNIVEPLVLVRKHSESITALNGVRSRQQRLELALSFLRDQLNGDSLEMKQEKEIRCHYYHGSMKDVRKLCSALIRYGTFNSTVLRYGIPSLLGDYCMSTLRRHGITESLTYILRRKAHGSRMIAP